MAESDGGPIVKIPTHLLSRLLYANPVCLLTTTAPTGPAADQNESNANVTVKDAGSATPSDLCTRNVMTISWLTPLDNRGHFICSMKSTRFSSSLLRKNPFFVLNIPVQGMEQLVIDVGGRTGADGVDKLVALGIKTCPPGWEEFLEVAKVKRRKGKQFDQIDTPLIALDQCVAHMVCQVDEAQERHGHDILYCSTIRAFSQADYWDGRNFAPKLPETPPYLSFLGSRQFAYTIPAPFKETANSR
ncbi:phosphatidylinositide phosphatase SAC1like protein putative [Phlyctochytrium arcticum]|nr:phosphatidylinositide phosphatase SAC1like protein putative [Phlyctochytrium arcticum]